MTVQELIYPAFRLSQITKVAGRTANVYEFADALATLNAMLEAWNIERLTAYKIERDVWPLDPPQASYSLGPNADWNAPRPVRIENAGIIIEGDHEVPLSVLDKDQWADVRLKSTTSTIPQFLYNDGSFPATRVWLWPVPTVTYTVALYTWHQLTAFAQLTDVVNLPPGYVRAIQFNLAVELAAANPQNTISPITIAKATEFKAALKSVNNTPPLMSLDPTLSQSSTFNILTGGYR